MKILLVILLSLLTFNISSAQSGWGYVNYTSYKTHNGNGSQNQYAAFPYSAAEFDNMLNTANSNTTITHTGETPIINLYNGSTAVPHWSGDYYAIKFQFWFVPQETGTYTFMTTSDDASDVSVNGNIIITDYGGHGTGNWKYGQVQMVAGTKYAIIARYQEFGGGDALYFRWSRPSAPSNYYYWNNEVTNIANEPTKKARMSFNFGSTLDKTKFAIGSALSSTGWIDITNNIDSVKVNNLYKPQSVTVTTTNTLSTLYNSILTVSDVYLAFKEFADAGGIFGGGYGTQFTYGIQYKNADINNDGVFDEADCFRLLQHLTGTKNIVDTFNLRKTLKMIPKLTYDSIGKSNWNTSSPYLGDTYNFDINTGKAIDTFYISGTWKGDVNLSHSATPPSNGVTTSSANFGMTIKTTNQMYADIISQLMNDSLYVEIKFNPGDDNIVGTQFQLNYDNTLLKYNKTEYTVNGNPTNYSADRGTFVNLGSLNSDGSQITSATYKILFITTQKLSGGLGLVNIETTEAVNKDGKPLTIKIQ